MSFIVRTATIMRGTGSLRNKWEAIVLLRHWPCLGGKEPSNKTRRRGAGTPAPEIMRAAQLDLLTGCLDRYGFVEALDG
jgi:hypothetical protein